MPGLRRTALVALVLLIVAPALPAASVTPPVAPPGDDLVEDLDVEYQAIPPGPQARFYVAFDGEGRPDSLWLESNGVAGLQTSARVGTPADDRLAPP